MIREDRKEDRQKRFGFDTFNFIGDARALRGLRSLFSNKTARALAMFVALTLAPFVVPALSRYRVLVPQSLLARLRLQTSEAAALVDEEAADTSGYSAQAKIEINLKPGEIEDPSGDALNSFFASLIKLENAGGQARICHYGDSPITNDGITSTVRRRLQLRFGDAGHGFILIAKPWGWYEHVGVIQEARGEWQSSPMSISKGEHLYGLGGVSFTTESANAWASFATTDEGEVGRSVSAFDIYFEVHPGGGDFNIEVDGQPFETVSTASDHIRSDFFRVAVDEGAHRLTIRAAGNGSIKMFGVALESMKQGIQYDSLGVNGAFIGLLAHYLDADHWAEQLRHRKPDLVIIGYGTNESQFERLPMDQYERDTREAIRRIREALPNVSIMLIGPMDRGMKGPGGSIVTRPMIPKLVRYQRRIAAETGCAFFDTFTAMGGEGTVARWFEARPKLMGGDLTHPTAQGSEIVGTLIYDALIRAYEGHKAESAKAK